MLRGATTAQRAAAPKTPSRGPGMLKGAVTAPRKPTGSTEPVGKPGRAQTEPASSRTTGTNSRGAGANAKTGNTRGTGSNAKTAARGTTGSTGRTGAARAGAQRGLLAGRPPPDRQSLPAGSGRFDLAGPALPRTPNPRCGQKETRPGRRDGRDGLRDRQHRHLPRSRTPHHHRRRRHCTLNPSTNDAGVGTPHSAPTPTLTLERVPLRNRSPQRPGPVRGTHTSQRHPKAA